MHPRARTKSAYDTVAATVCMEFVGNGYVVNCLQLPGCGKTNSYHQNNTVRIFFNYFCQKRNKKKRWIPSEIFSKFYWPLLKPSSCVCFIYNYHGCQRRGVCVCVCCRYLAGDWKNFYGGLKNVVMQRWWRGGCTRHGDCVTVQVFGRVPKMWWTLPFHSAQQCLHNLSTAVLCLRIKADY